MTLGRILRATSALSVGIAVAGFGIHDKCHITKDLFIAGNKSFLQKTSLTLPKVHAVECGEQDDNCQLSCEIREALETLKCDTGFGDYALLQYAQYGGKHRYHRLEYRDFLLYYDSMRQNPAVTYEFITKQSLCGDTNCRLRWVAEDRVECNARYKSKDPYVKAHMATRANHKKTLQDQADTYFMTNASPQHKCLNSGLWRVIEQLTRDITSIREVQGVHVFTGPVWINECNGFLGKTNVQIPTHFFKVIIYRTKCCQTGAIPSYHVMSFLVPNESLNADDFYGHYVPFLAPYRVDIEQIDGLTGLGLGKNRKFLTYEST